MWLDPFLVTTIKLVFKHDCVRSKEARDCLGSGQSCLNSILRWFSQNSRLARSCSLSLSCGSGRSWSLGFCGNLWAGLGLRRWGSTSWLHDWHGLAKKAAKTAWTSTFTGYSLHSFHDFASHVKHLCKIHTTCKSSCNTCKSTIAFLCVWFCFGLVMFLGGGLWSFPVIWVFIFFLGLRLGVILGIRLGLIVAIAIRIAVVAVASVIRVVVSIAIVTVILTILIIVAITIVWISSIIALSLRRSDAKHTADRGHPEKFLRVLRPSKLCQSVHCRLKAFIGVIWDTSMVSVAPVDLVSKFIDEILPSIMFGALVLNLGDSLLEGNDIIGVFLMMGFSLSFLFIFSIFFLSLGLLGFSISLILVIRNLLLVETEFFFKLFSSFEFLDNFFEIGLSFF